MKISWFCLLLVFFGVIQALVLVSEFYLDFFENNLLLKSLNTFSLEPINNLMLFRKDFLSASFTSPSILFNSFANLLCSLSASSNVNFSSYIPLLKIFVLKL